MSKDELLTSLFDDRPHLLAEQVAAWLASSRRFSAFVAGSHSKIRKKLRTARDRESLLDLQLELETAYLLLREKALSLEYEPQPGARARGPDFAVRYTTSTEFMVEVARLRALPQAPSGSPEHTGITQPPDSPPGAPQLDRRLAGVLGRKLGQLLPQLGNLLLVGVEAPPPTPEDIHAAVLCVQQRAEADDPALVHRHGFRGRSDFFSHYRRLSAVLLRAIPLHAGEPAVLWLNPQAKYPLPSKVRTALSRSHTL